MKASILQTFLAFEFKYFDTACRDFSAVDLIFLFILRALRARVGVSFYGFSQLMRAFRARPISEIDLLALTQAGPRRPSSSCTSFAQLESEPRSFSMTVPPSAMRSTLDDRDHGNARGATNGRKNASPHRPTPPLPINSLAKLR